MSMLLFISNTILALGLGFFIGRDSYHWRGYKPILKSIAPKPKEMLKVIRRQPIKTFDERRLESIENGKPIIKVLHK